MASITENVLLDPALHIRPGLEPDRAGFNCGDAAFDLDIPCRRSGLLLALVNFYQLVRVPMKPKTYLETSIVSYLTAWQSRELVLATHQQVTRDWWASRGNFELFSSQFVLDEAAAGDDEAAASRLAALAETAVLEVTEDAGSSRRLSARL
jgi:hypothetical protein